MGMEISVIVNKAVAGLVKSANNPIATLMIANPILLTHVTHRSLASHNYNSDLIVAV
ncbi:MAG: hypothetical protein ACD_40C00329G0002 [uncultured bacterium]|nr:MAG: hypothetical protein ACD_40C00329G0002 [uncultured bacterium]